MSESTANTAACFAALEAALALDARGDNTDLVRRKPGQPARPEYKKECAVEASSGIRYKNGKVEQCLLDRLFQHFLKIEHLPKMAQPSKPVDTVGVIVSRHLDKGETNGTSYLKWMLSDLLDNTVACFIQGDAMDAHKHLAPGVVVAALGAAWGNKGQLKVSRSKQVKEIGWAFDFAYCSAKKKNGERCRNPVNKTKSEFCDWHLSQGHKRLAFNARPECTGTVLGAESYQPGKDRLNSVFRGKIITKKTVPKTLAQMDKYSKEYCEKRGGSRGAKAINLFVDQQREAERKKALKKREAKLYKSPERPKGVATSNKAAPKSTKAMPHVVPPLRDANR